MKRIVCIGSLSTDVRDLPADPIMGLYNELRNFNTKCSVKGIFLVSRLNLMLILEGGYTNLAEIQYKLRRDERLCNISVVANHDLNEGYFDKWLIRFLRLDSPSHVQFMQRLKNQIGKHVETTSHREKQILSTFLLEQEEKDEINSTHEEKALNNGTTELDLPSESKPSSFDNTILSLSVWPKPTQVKLNQSVMKTCSMLSIRKVSYEVLKHTGLWPNEKDLNSFLAQLEKLGALEVTRSKANTNELSKSSEEQVVAHPTRDRFSQLLKKFISTPKSRAS